MHNAHDINTTLTSNISMTVTLYKTFNQFNCTILLGRSESSKITFFKDYILEIIKFKVSHGKEQKSHFQHI